MGSAFPHPRAQQPTHSQLAARSCIPRFLRCLSLLFVHILYLFALCWCRTASNCALPCLIILEATLGPVSMGAVVLKSLEGIISRSQLRHTHSSQYCQKTKMNLGLNQSRAHLIGTSVSIKWVSWYMMARRHPPRRHKIYLRKQHRACLHNKTR